MSRMLPSPCCPTMGLSGNPPVNFASAYRRHMKSQFTSKKPAAGYPSSVNGSQGTPPSSTPNLESAPPQQTPDQPQFEIPQTAGPNSPNAAKRENVWSRSKPEVNSQPTSPVITSEQQPAEEHAVRQQGLSGNIRSRMICRSQRRPSSHSRSHRPYRTYPSNPPRRRGSNPPPSQQRRRRNQ